jgi:hypothetical protein
MLSGLLLVSSLRSQEVKIEVREIRAESKIKLRGGSEYMYYLCKGEVKKMRRRGCGTFVLHPSTAGFC